MNAERPERPQIVTLCGSTRFKTEFEEANRAETLAGRIVLSCGVFGHADGVQLICGQKAELDELHFSKIRMSDEIYVINPGGYIGESTRREIAYARSLDKPVRYLVESDSALRVRVILFKPSGKYYTAEEWRCPADAIGPHDMAKSLDFRRIAGGPVLVEEQEPWGYPHLFPGTP